MKSFIIDKYFKKKTTTKTTEKIPRVVSTQEISSIDKRNLRSSQSKQQIKRKSAKTVSALLKSVKSDLNVTSTIKSSVSDQTIQEEENKSDKKKRITRNILSSALIQQQYRVPNIFKSALKANGERKPSLLSSNFLDRYTPSNHTETVTK
jgi:K+-sensing histidine kinase KdpD